MSRTANLYGPRTNREIARQVKNFNARRRYELRKDPDAENWLPVKASTKAIKASVQTRTDLNRTLADMRSFTKKTAEPVFLDKGVIMTKWELQTIEKNIELANRRRAKRLKELAPDTTRGTMGLAEQHNLRPIKFDANKLTADEIQHKKRLAAAEAKKTYRATQDQLYKDNYIQAVTENLGELADPILDLIRPLSPAQMLQGYKSDPVLNIKFISDPLKRAQIAAEVLQHWREFLGISEPVDDTEDDWNEEDQD